MSTTLDDARAVLDNQGGGWLREAIEHFIDAKLAVAREEIARSRAPVGEDARAAAHAFINVDDGMGVTVVTPPAKDTGEGERDAGWTHEAGEELRRAYERLESISPLKLNTALRHGFEAIAVLERRLAEAEPFRDKLAETLGRLMVAERERDDALASLETAGRRIGELEAEVEEWKDRLVLGRNRRNATLTPDAGTARSEEEGE